MHYFRGQTEVKIPNNFLFCILFVSFRGTFPVFFYYLKQMNLHLPQKRLNTEATRNCSAFKIYSTPSTMRFSSTPKDIDKECKLNTSDFKAFKAKNWSKLQEQIDCSRLIRLSYPNSFVTQADLFKLEFSPLSYPIKDLILYSKTMIESTSERRAISRSFNLFRLIQLIADSYNVSAYHNFTHAFSVLLLLFQSYSQSERLQKIISQKQWFFVFIAALVHDLNHPGTTNAFEVKQKSQLAKQAGNQSVLEKMHLRTFWKLLKGNSQVNFLQGYSKLQSNEIRKLITRLVIATDASHHSSSVEGLRKLNRNTKFLKGETSLFLVQQLFRGCDIGNPCLPFQNYISWSVLIAYQFDCIARKEEQLGLQVTSFMKYEGEESFYRKQIGFIGSIVLPLWKELCNILPELQEMLHNVTQNMKELRRRIHQQSVC